MAWRAPGRRLPEVGGTPALDSFRIRVLRRLTRIIRPSASTAKSRRERLIADFSMCAASTNSVSSTTTRSSRARRGAAAERCGESRLTGLPVPGSSASVLQYTSFGESWDKALVVSLTHRRPPVHSFRKLYVSKAEDTSGDFQTSTIPQDIGQAETPPTPQVCQSHSIRPANEGRRSRSATPIRLQRHGRFPAPCTCGRLTVGSGRPFNILAGATSMEMEMEDLSDGSCACHSRGCEYQCPA